MELCLDCVHSSLKAALAQRRVRIGMGGASGCAMESTETLEAAASHRQHRAIRAAAFTLTEVIVAVAVIGIVMAGLYTMMKTNVTVVGQTRNNLAVNQILTEKFEALRIYNWDQLRSNGFVPTNFVVNLNPNDSLSQPFYTGSVAIVWPAPIAESYRSNLAEITVTVNWMADKRLQTRSMASYVTKYGLQQFINK